MKLPILYPFISQNILSLSSRRRYMSRVKDTPKRIFAVGERHSSSCNFDSTFAISTSPARFKPSAKTSNAMFAMLLSETPSLPRTVIIVSSRETSLDTACCPCHLSRELNLGTFVVVKSERVSFMKLERFRRLQLTAASTNV